ncbi:unnamed protein product, partial [marine sediment metagenome]
DCDLNTLNLPEVSCGIAWGTHWEIYKNGNIEYEESSIGGRYEKDIHLDYGNELSILGYCRELLGGKSPLPINKITILQKVVMLEESWAGSLPFRTLSESKGCILNEEIDEDTNVDSYFDIDSGEQKNKPLSTYNSLSQFPTNWRVGDNYIFVKDWQTGIADISLNYDKNNNAYWCGGTSGNRKIYSVDPVYSTSGKCYSIPKSVALSNVECCEDVDCLSLGFGAKYVCNPDNWKCEKTKPCNSQLDCESTFGEGICENHKMNKWVCDINKKWGDYAGTCINSIREVSQCPSDCSSKEYYNEEEGICKSLKKILNCPSGKCCISGGSYKEKLCRSSFQCCTLQGSFVGVCAEDCFQLNKEDLENTGMTGRVTGVSEKSSTGIIIAVIFFILIGGAIAYFVYTKKKGTKLKKDVKKDLKEKGKHCKKCGKLLGPKDKFCTGCGKGV